MTLGSWSFAFGSHGDFCLAKFFFIQHFHDCVEEPITLVADPTLLAAEPAPRVPSIPSCMLATAASRTLMFVLVMHGRWHTNHRWRQAPQRRNDPAAAFRTSIVVSRKRRCTRFGSLDHVQEPPGLVVVAIAAVGPVEQEGEGVNRYLVAHLHGAPKRVEAWHDCTALLPEDEAHPAAEAGLWVADGGQSGDERRAIFRSYVESTPQHTT